MTAFLGQKLSAVAAGLILPRKPPQTTKDREGVGRSSPFARTAYSIMGRIAAAMPEAKIDQEVDAYLKRAMSGDYDNPLRVSEETVTITFA